MSPLNIKYANVIWLPPYPDEQGHGWLAIDNEIWNITKIYNFGDFGCNLDTFFIEKDGETKEIYSHDEGETFTFDVW